MKAEHLMDIHEDLLDNSELTDIAKEFIGRNEKI